MPAGHCIFRLPLILPTQTQRETEAGMGPRDPEDGEEGIGRDREGGRDT